MYVDVRCAKDVKILELSQEKMQEIRQKYDKQGFSTKVLAFQNRILKQEKKFPLDYIMQVPKAIERVDEEQAKRENVLKNVVMRIVIDIRERKKRPKLSDFLKVYKEKKD